MAVHFSGTPAVAKPNAETWGSILVQPMTHQVLKTNIRIDVVPSKHVLRGEDLSRFTPSAALVCEKDGGGEYQFISGVVITKVCVFVSFWLGGLVTISTCDKLDGFLLQLVPLCFLGRAEKLSASFRIRCKRGATP
jgi:hypothetical protein